MQRLSRRHVHTAIGVLRSLALMGGAVVACIAIVVLVVVAFVAALIASVASVPAGKDALELRRTALGHMAPPPGTALVSEYYRPARSSIAGRECASYRRTFATNDVPAFARAIGEAARSSGYSTSRHFNADDPNINTFEGGYSRAGTFEGQDVTVDLAFFDLDTSQRRGFERSIDTGAWRWAVWIIVFDDCHD